MKQEPLRVVIADDHAAVRAGVRESVEDGGFEVCGEAADAHGAVELALAKRPDLCLVDVNMPGGGIRAAGKITKALPECVVVMLTVSRDDRGPIRLTSRRRRRLPPEGHRPRPPAARPPRRHGWRGPGAEDPRLTADRRVPHARAPPPPSFTRTARLGAHEPRVGGTRPAGRGLQHSGDRRAPVRIAGDRCRHISGLLEKLGAPYRWTAVRLFRDACAAA